MVGSEFLKARVSRDVKQRVQGAAQRQLITESIWLRQAIDVALRALPDASSATSLQTDNAPRGERLYVRLRHGDRLILRERASARGMAPATYVSVLVRAHLRQLAPLPKAELMALKRLTAELGAIGRNLNQIAHAMNRDQRPHMPGRNEVMYMLKLCEGLRDATKALIKTNIASWEAGRGETHL